MRRYCRRCFDVPLRRPGERSSCCRRCVRASGAPPYRTTERTTRRRDRESLLRKLAVCQTSLRHGARSHLDRCATSPPPRRKDAVSGTTDRRVEDRRYGVPASDWRRIQFAVEDAPRGDTTRRTSQALVGDPFQAMTHCRRSRPETHFSACVRHKPKPAGGHPTYWKARADRSARMQLCRRCSSSGQTLLRRRGLSRDPFFETADGDRVLHGAHQVCATDSPLRYRV